MKFRIVTYTHADINPEHYGIDPNLPMSEICDKLSKCLNDSNEDIFVILEENESNIVVSEIKSGEEE